VAHARLILLAATIAGCGGSSSPPASSAAVATAAKPAAFPQEDAAWGKFHSKRFQLTVPLPDGKAWKIDDHRQPSLVARHPPTDSRLEIAAARDVELMNRAKCEQRARTSGFVPPGDLATVEDEVYVGPEAYDSRVWVAIGAEPNGRVEGHVFLFGAFLRQCLFVHFQTAVPSSKEEDVLAQRLAIGSTRVVKAIVLDPPRTHDDAVVPREKR
jgi:hypothetical protein